MSEKGEKNTESGKGDGADKSRACRIRDFFLMPNRAVKAVVYIAALLLCSGSVMFSVSPYSSHPLVYFLYAAAALFLAWAVTLFVRAVRRLTAAARERAESGKAGRLMTDRVFRAMAFSFVSLVFSALFAVMNGVVAVVYLSPWYGVMSAYWFSLCVVRIVVTVSARVAGRSEDPERAGLRVYLGSGIALIVLEIAVTAAVTLRVMSHAPSAGNEITAIASAAYTFVKFAMAIINLVKARKLRDPVLAALRVIGMTDALMSLLALETTMLAVFGGDGDLIALTAVLGFCVCAVTLAMGITATVRAAVSLRKPRSDV